MEPLTTAIIFELMYISMGLTIFGLILNRILGIRSSVMKGLRDKAKNIQERLKQAQALGDPQITRDLQLESMQLMKQMMKKQFLPMCIRCIIFLGIFFILGLIYGQYEFWFWIYFLWSLTFSLTVFGLTKLYKKVTGKEDKKKSFAKEIMELSSPSQQSSLYITNIKPTESLDSLSLEDKEDSVENEREDAWKDRI